MLDSVNLWPLMLQLSACLCKELDRSYGGPTCFCGVLPGINIPADYCDCTSGSCGQAWVRLNNVYSSGQFPNPSLGPNSCFDPIAARIDMGVLRCVPGIGSRGEMPDEEEQAEAVHVQVSDVAAIYRAIHCCLPANPKDWVIGQYLPIGPLGNCGGGAVAITVRLDGAA